MSRLYIARVPAFSSLEAFSLDLTASNGGRGAFPQVLKAKCRELARADSSILVAPCSVSGSCGVPSQLSLWIVTKSGFINNPRLQERFRQLEFKLSHQVRLNHSILQTCFKFTLTARLAPKWNQVTTWLVKGTDFLSTGRAQALNLEVGVTASEITVTLNVKKLILNFLKPDDLQVTTTTLNRFRTEPNFVIQESNIYSNRCLLLPNFTVGYIFSASHHLPHSKEIPTYDRLRLHWKKQHGIIIPERQDLFYQIFFRSNPSNLFSYPGCCAFKDCPVVIPSRDIDEVASAFVTDIHARMTAICGQHLKFDCKALVPTAQLQSAIRGGGGGGSGGGGLYLNTRLAPAPHRPSMSHAVGAQVPRAKQVPSNSRFPQPNQPQHETREDNIQAVPLVKPSTSHEQIALQRKSNAPFVPIFRPRPSPSMTLEQQTPVIRPPVPVVPTFYSRSKVSSHPTKSISNGAQKVPSQKRSVSTTDSLLEPRATGPPSSKRVCLPPTHPLPSTSLSTAINQQVVPDLSAAVQLQQDTSLTMNFSSNKKSRGNQKLEERKKSLPIYVDGVSNEILKKIMKTKVALLKKWLQENGLKSHSKGKKEDLVKMVATHIKDTGKPFEIVA